MSSISIERFHELSDGDPEGLKELIDLYLTKTSEQIVELKGAIASKSGPDVARIAHSMIGANLMVGMNSLIPPLRGLEECGEKNRFDPASLHLEQMTLLFEEIKGALNQASPRRL